MLITSPSSAHSFSDPYHVFLITRFGVGQSNPTFFDHILQYFENVFVPGIIATPCTHISLLLIVDVNIPRTYVQKLQDLFPTRYNLYIWAHDPLFTLSLTPDYALIFQTIGCKPSSRLNMIRVDADDQINPNLIHRIRLILQSLDLQSVRRISINPTSGLNYYLSSCKYLSLVKENYSVQFLSDLFDNNFKHVYSFSHKNIASQIYALGSSFSFVLNDTPYWLRLVHSNSNSYTNLSVRKFFHSYMFLQVFLNRISNMFRTTVETKSFSSSNIARSHFDTSRITELTPLPSTLPAIPFTSYLEIPSSLGRLESKEYILSHIANLNLSGSSYLASQQYDELKSLFYSF